MKSILIRLIIIGEGAQKIREKHLGKHFSSNYQMTVGAEFAMKEMNIGGYTIKFQTWELLTGLKFKTVRSVYCYGAGGIIIVFNKGRKKSFNEITQYFNEFKKHNGKRFEDFSSDQLVLLGLKDNGNDIRKSKEEGEALAQTLGMKYYEMTVIESKKIGTILTKMGEAYIDQFTN
ncbi:MAG: hypothetical protein ACFFAJ_12870 [Candidatus Hodarchaeota archaeon]